MATTTAKKKTAKVPDEAMTNVEEALRRLADPMLDAERVGRFCYITHEGAPLCRLAWNPAGNHPWDFAIYKYSNQKYGTLEFAADSGSAFDCIETALRVYNLK